MAVVPDASGVESTTAPQQGQSAGAQQAEERGFRSSHAVSSRSPRDSLPNTGDKLRSSIACAGFVCFIPLLCGPAATLANATLGPLGTDGPMAREPNPDGPRNPDRDGERNGQPLHHPDALRRAYRCLNSQDPYQPEMC
jgi:hypothetical protein